MAKGFKGAVFDMDGVLGAGKRTVFVNDEDGGKRVKIGVGEAVREIEAGEGYDFEVVAPD